MKHECQEDKVCNCRGDWNLSDAKHCLSCKGKECSTCGFNGFDEKDVREFILEIARQFSRRMDTKVWNKEFAPILTKLAGDKLI